MGRKNVHPRVSMDALELLEYIAMDGAFESIAELRAYTGDKKDRWPTERVTRAVDELVATERVTRNGSGTLQAIDRGDYSSITTVDDELGVRVRVMTAVYAADESIDFGITEAVRAEWQAESDLGDLMVQKLRRVNGLNRDNRRAAALPAPRKAQP